VKFFRIDRLAWIFMRVSGVVLIALIFTHLIVNLMQDGGVKAIDFAFVAGKLANPFWQWFDVTLLWLALIHGTNKRVLLALLAISTITLIVLGTLVIFTLDPCPVGTPTDLLPSFCPAG
jgi:succinate dehydrogenase / fumarate reductase membrane anchor subunit